MAEKRLADSIEAKRAMIEPNHRDISLRRQRQLIGLHRSTYYYEPTGKREFNLRLMRLINEQYLHTPFYGWPRRTAYLRCR
jgi:putative transposase